MSPVNLWMAGFWILAALGIEATLLPHWLPVRWIPQFSFLILLFAALRSGFYGGTALGLLLGMGQAFFSAIPGFGVIWVYAGLGALAGASKRVVFIESPLAQWLTPVGFGLLTELAFFWMMPWDDAPLGWGDFAGLIRAPSLPLTWLLSGAVYGVCHRSLFSKPQK